MYDNDAMFLNLRSSKEIMSYKLTAFLKICGEFVHPSQSERLLFYAKKVLLELFIAIFVKNKNNEL